MENRPLISVIVPVYNMQDYLEVCVDSVLSQTYENLEIILVDDGSSDSSPEICDAYAKKDSRIKVVHKENGGISSARNAGLAVVSGEYVGFIDSDDSAKPNMFEVLYENLVSCDADVSVCKFSNCDSQAGDKAVDNSEETPMVFSREEALENIFVGRHFVGHVWNKLFKTEHVKDIRFFEDLHSFEDVPFAVAAILKAKKVCFTKKRLYNYLSRRGSVLRSGFNEKLLQAIPSCDRIGEMLKESGLDTSMKKYYDTFVILSDIVVMRRFGKDKKAIKKYAPSFRKSIRAHFNRDSLPYMSSNTKRNMLLIMISWRLYFFTLDIVRTH